VQRRIWLIVAWNLWEHRNNFLHNGGTIIYTLEMTALDKEIQREWETGRTKYAYLFKNGHL
jgi:hypothetical protein